MGLIKSCVLCSLKTGSFFVCMYTFMLAAMLLIFNIHDYVYAPQYIAWTRIISFVFSVFLFIAALSLLIGLFKKSTQLMGVWIGIFLIYILYQIAFVSWNLYYYTNAYEPVPEEVRQTMLINIIVFGVLVFVNILALVGVHSYREYLGGKGLIPVPVMA